MWWALSVFALSMLMGCGGQQRLPPPDDDPVTDPREAQADPEGLTESPQRPATRAEELEALVKHLGTLPPADHAPLIEGLPGDVLQKLLPKLPPAALPWARLRLALLAEHQRKPREARQHLADAVARSAGHPAAARIEQVRARMEAFAAVQRGRLGVVLPLSGPFGAIGKSALPSIKIAAKRAGIKLVIEDTAGKAEQAALAVERLVYEHKVPAIVGPIGALESASAAQVAQRLQVPLMTLTSRADVTRMGSFIFRHRLTPEAQAKTLARYAVKRMGHRRFAILYPDTDHGRAMTRAFWRTVEALGGQIRGAQAYGPNDVDFSDPIKKLIGRYELSIRKKDPRWVKLNRKARDRALHVAPEVDFEALFIPDRGRRLRTLLPYLTYWDIELKTDRDMLASDLRGKYSGKTPQLVQILGASGFGDPKLVERQIEQANNAIFVDGWRPEYSRSTRFARAYETVTGKAPGALAAHAYDAARIMCDELKRAGGRDTIRRRLLALRDYEGVVGTTRFNGNGDAVFGLFVFTVQPEEGVVPRRGDRPAGN